MPLLMSRNKSPEVGESSSSAPSFRSRSSASSHRTSGGSSQRQAELRARYEMAQAIQKPWPLHLLENGVKPASSACHGATLASSSSGSSRTTRASSKQHSSSAAAVSASRSSSTRRESRSTITTSTNNNAITQFTSLDLESSRSSKKKRNSTNSLDKLSLSPTLVSNWIRRASKDSDKSARSSSPTSSSTNTSPIHSPKDL